MQFSPEFHPQNPLLYCHPTATSPPVRCSCRKCFKRRYTEYESLHFLQREQLEARERYMHTATTHVLPLPPSSGIPTPFGRALDTRYYYPASTLATQSPHYPYDRDSGDYGKLNIMHEVCFNFR